MTVSPEISRAYADFLAECKTIATSTVINDDESRAEQLARIRKVRKDYGAFVEYYFPTLAKCPCGRFQIDAANYLLKNKNTKAVFKWARAHAKSTHFDVFIPLWLKCQEKRQINFVVIVGKSQDNANRLLSQLQAQLEYNRRYTADFGNQHNAGRWSEGEFITSDGVKFLAVGRGQSPRGLIHDGHRPDYIIIDDLDDDELCRNPHRVTDLTNWVKEALFGALDGGRGRFVMVGNLIAKTSVLANIAATKDVHVSQVNIYDRAGNVTWKEKWTKDEVQSMEQFMGYRSFQKEYMNNPITEGAIFRNDWIRWKTIPPLNKYDKIVAYCDPSFKSKQNDYKAIKAWGAIGTELHNIRNFVRQCSVAEMVRWFYDFHESLPDNVICQYWMEANFMQDMILDDFITEGKRRGYQLPIRADRRKKPEKLQRIEAMSPLWERGFTFYDSRLQNDPDTLAGLEQLLAIEKGSQVHDDAPDADEGAIWMLRQQIRQQTFQPIIGARSTNANIW